jgi:hypothetical protein
MIDAVARWETSRDRGGSGIGFAVDPQIHRESCDVVRAMGVDRSRIVVRCNRWPSIRSAPPRQRFFGLRVGLSST